MISLRTGTECHHTVHYVMYEPIVQNVLTFINIYTYMYIYIYIYIYVIG
jgi:hypothetical protein